MGIRDALKKMKEYDEENKKNPRIMYEQGTWWKERARGLNEAIFYGVDLKEEQTFEQWLEGL